MPKQQRLLTGTILLTAAGLISRLIGFFYRIFLSHTIGAEGLGIYQLILPIFSLSYAFTVMGIQTALSRCISAKSAVGDQKGAKDLLITGSVLSLLLSLAASFFLYQGSEWFCRNILSEAACIPLMKLMALTIPFGTLHICFVSYYFAARNTWIPSLGQLLEQLLRVSASWLFYSLMLKNGTEATPMLAVAGTAAAEIFSLLYIVFFLRKDFHKEGYVFCLASPWKKYASEIIQLAAPLSANRIILNLMKSGESILIPICLVQYGLTSSEALSIYGVLTGMALPLILFPSTITQSVSVMLLPAVSESKAQNNYRRIAFTVEKTIRYGLFLGILCFGIFFTCGDSIGILLFHSQEAGQFISMLAFLCPFLYLSSTLASIINGLGKTACYFIQNLTGLTVRIICVLLLVPKTGIAGCLWGILGNEILLVILSLCTLYREHVLIFSAWNSLVKPGIFLILSAGGSHLADTVLSSLGMNDFIVTAAKCFVICITYICLLLTFQLIHLPKNIDPLHLNIDKK
ncbi:MAG: oligosaccharide flippase family protein [Ruminococcus sp.]|jgi:stage V sporulation protein B